MLLLLPPLPQNVHNSVSRVVDTTANSGLTDFFFSSYIDRIKYLFIYLLIIYILSPSKKDLSASLDVLAFPPKSVSISRKKITTGEVVFGFIPGSTESHGNA